GSVLARGQYSPVARGRMAPDLPRWILADARLRRAKRRWRRKFCSCSCARRGRLVGKQLIEGLGRTWVRGEGALLCLPSEIVLLRFYKNLDQAVVSRADVIAHERAIGVESGL